MKKIKIISMLLFSVASLVITIKYINLKREYKKTEQDKVNWCKKYHHLKQVHENDSLTIILMEKDYVEQWEENQIFSSMLSEIENEPCGHEVLQKLWKQQSQTFSKNE